jgi:NTP pyrophosphatase (non-canonical NTP hydrolase)
VSVHVTVTEGDKQIAGWTTTEDGEHIPDADFRLSPDHAPVAESVSFSEDAPIRLTFQRVREVSHARMLRWHDTDSQWSGADWSNAMQGEAGEAGNVVKKLRRLECSLAPGPADPPKDELLKKLADEIADTFLYLDLLAEFYGIDIPTAVIDKFNRVSERQGFPERLP